MTSAAPVAVSLQEGVFPSRLCFSADALLMTKHTIVESRGNRASGTRHRASRRGPV